MNGTIMLCFSSLFPILSLSLSMMRIDENCVSVESPLVSGGGPLSSLPLLSFMNQTLANDSYVDLCVSLT